MTEKRLPWFACYPDKWLVALAEMKPDVGYVYLVICLRIYEKRGPIPDTKEALGRRTGFRPSHIERIIKHLCDLGKLKQTPDGLINPFALREIQSQKVKRSSKKEQQNQQNDSPHIQLQLHKESNSRARRKTAATTTMPKDWKPNEEGIGYGRKLGFDQIKIEQMARACRDYHLKHGTLLYDLDATWRQWCENEVLFVAKKSLNNTQHRPGMITLSNGRKIPGPVAPSHLKDRERAEWLENWFINAEREHGEQHQL